MSLPANTLAKRLDAGPLSVAELAPILDDVLLALERAGLVDRALTTDRVVLDGERARLLEPPTHANPEAPSHDDGFQAKLRTFLFMAPEQVRGQANVDARADIYAIGVIAFVALTGRAPFAGTNALILIAKKLEMPPPTLGHIMGRSFPPLLESFVATSMATDRARRYPRIGVARAAWKLACEDLPSA